MLRSVAPALIAAGLVAGPAIADDVHLTNGEAFEGVIAERVGDSVRIQLEFGEIKLPATSVARIDSFYSPLADYRERRALLLARRAGAADWLELARWARAHDLEHGHREALLEAAALDPELEGLEPGMRDLNYVFDAELDRWIPYAEHLRRTAPPPAVARRAEPQPSDHREVEETLSRTVELLALAQLERETRETREATAPAGPAVTYGFPVAHFGGGFFFGPPLVHHPVDGAPDPGEEPAPVTSPDLFRRAPGSLLPVGGANRGTRVRQPGSLLPVSSGRR